MEPKIIRSPLVAALACASTLAAAADLPSTRAPPPPPVPVVSDYSGWTFGAIVGTAGVGGEVGYRINNSFGLRGQASWLPLDIGFNTSSVDYNSRVDIESGAALADYYPWGGIFRITGGLRIGDNGFRLSGTPMNPVSVNTPLGPIVIPPSSIGPLVANVRYGDVEPYLGAGLEASPFPMRNLVIGLDAGAMLLSSPSVTLTAPNANIPPIANNAFQNFLNSEQAQLLADARRYHAYPIVDVAFKLRF